MQHFRLRYFAAFFCMVLLLSLYGGIAQAETHIWQGDAADPTDYADPANWHTVRVPAPDDHAIIHDNGAAEGMPVIDSEVPAVRFLTPSWFAVATTLTVVTGGRVDTHQLIIGETAGPESDGVLLVDGGEVFARRLEIGAAGNGRVEVRSGTLTVSAVTFGQDGAGGSGALDVSGGRVFLGGDLREEVQAWISDGRLTGYGSASRIAWDYAQTRTGYVCLRGIAAPSANRLPVPAKGHLLLAQEAAALTLEWTAGDGAVAHDVYLGTDAVQVGAAEAASGAYLGRVTASDFALSALDENATYFWRVDAVSDGGIVTKGEVWSFRVGKSAVLDLESDGWVATDALGRALPDAAASGPPRQDRVIGMYYNLWHGTHPDLHGPNNITEIIAANPSDPDLLDYQIHFWAEPEAGFYIVTDPWVHRRNIMMLAQAGVEVLILEATNGESYIEGAGVLMDVLREVQAEGYARDMKIVFWTHSYSPRVVEEYYAGIYAEGLYPDLWFYWDGKPLMLGYPDGVPEDSPRESVSAEVRDFFTWRECWAWDDGENKWQFVDFYPQDYGWSEYSDVAEQVVMSAASHATLNIGKSYSNGAQPARNIYDLTGLEDQGLYLSEHWQQAQRLDPEFLFLTSWNEWFAGGFVRQAGEPEFYFLGELVEVGEIYFVDAYNAEYNRDMAPMKGGYTDNYYYQLTGMLRKFRGMETPPAAGGAAPVRIDGAFADWTYVTPDFRDMTGDTAHRKHLGWGAVGTLRNATGRNDFILARVARDQDSIAFYAECAGEITAYEGNRNWMLLFIDVDQNAATGWMGYDYLVNRDPDASGYTTLEAHAGSGWNWSTISSAIPYAVEGKKFELKIRRDLLGLASGSGPFGMDFHWADNLQTPGDLHDFFTSGDSAPDRRYNYRYQTAKQNRTILMDLDFEEGLDGTWGDWDLTTDQGYQGSQGLECSADDDAGLTRSFDFSGMDSFQIAFRIKLQYVSSWDNLFLYYHDGADFNLIDNLADTGTPNDVWMRYSDVRYNSGEDAKYFNGPITFHIQGASLTGGSQYVWLDDFLVSGMQKARSAHGPFPPDGAEGVPTHQSLGWTMAPGAESQQVYFGTDPSPPLHADLSVAEQSSVPSLVPDRQYYWRVDTTIGAETLPGPTWSFTTVDRPDAAARPTWMLY